MERIETIEEFQKMLDTLLLGWPKGENWPLPTLEEAKQIECIFSELKLQIPELIETTAWRIAGNSVARFRRDILNHRKE